MGSKVSLLHCFVCAKVSLLRCFRALPTTYPAVKPRSYSLRHALALEVHDFLAARPELLGKAHQACAARRSKGRRVQMLLDSQQPLFELRRRFRETGAHKHLVEENRTDLELARSLRGTY